MKATKNILSDEEVARYKKIAEEVKAKGKAADPKAAAARIDAACQGAAKENISCHHEDWAHHLLESKADSAKLCKEEFAKGDKDHSGSLAFKEAVATVQKLVEYVG